MSTELKKVILATNGDQERTPPSEDPKTRKQKDRRAWLKKAFMATIATAGAALLGTRADTTHAQPNASIGVKGVGGDIGVEGISGHGVGVGGYGAEFVGVVGYSPIDIGVVASCLNGLTALQVEGGIRLVGNAIGFPSGRDGVQRAGFASITVFNPFVEPDCLVLITPESDPGGPLWVTGTTHGSFVVNRSGSLPAFNFSYLIINFGFHVIGPTIPWL